MEVLDNKPQVASYSAPLHDRFPELSLVTPTRGMPILMVPADRLLEVTRFLYEAPECQFDYLDNLTSVDWLDRFAVVYHLHSIPLGHSLALKVEIPHEQPVVPSVYSIWGGADLQEREVYDMMGIEFVGHPNLKRVLLWEGFEGHPLRKDFRQQAPAEMAHSLLRRREDRQVQDNGD